MELGLLLTILTLLVRPLGLPIFETVLGILLLTPVLAFPLAAYVPITGLTYYLIMLGLISVIFLLRMNIQKNDTLNKKEALPLVIFFATFLVFRFFCLSWPDFISIGERLRDYAILNSVIISPTDLREPWLNGYPLNYYAYWYRFGAFLAKALDLNTWDVYHTLQSFTYALYCSCCFRIFSRLFGFSYLTAGFSSLLIVFGSNVQGLISFLMKEDGWWGPSRVITGAINEFPAWSFLLGDLHPHYLNLALIPFFLLVFVELWKISCTEPTRFVLMLGMTTIPPLWIYNANAWDVPVWGVVVATLLGAIICCKISVPLEFSRALLNSRRNLFSPRLLALSTLVLSLSLFLYNSSRNILPNDYPVDWVKYPILRTPILELLRHWGLPLGLICFSIIRGASLITLRIIAVALPVSLTFSSDALPLLLVLLGLIIYRGVNVLKKEVSLPESLSFSTILAESCGVVAIVLLIVPEIVFLNDPYGAEIERMNTIFKLYSCNWFFMHVFALYITRRTLLETWSADFCRLDFKIIGQLSLLICFSLFFVRTIDKRPFAAEPVLPREEGLSRINQEYPGAAKTVQRLRALPRGVVLEAQGDAYANTTHVATLSGQEAYLGWANHINLILKSYAEVSRREQVTKVFYEDSSCEKKQDLINSEKINYVVFGPLEKARYAKAKVEDFSCLKKIIEEGGYVVFGGG